MMPFAGPAVLRLRAFWELLRYDLVGAVLGFRGVRRGLRRPVARKPLDDGFEARVSRAVDWASSLYWKRVRCLQRAMVETRLLRAYGVPAELVIGCRLAPFVGHAWVEVGGRVLSGPAGYPQHLEVLDRV